MTWYHMPAYFLGGAFLANFVPHFVAGVTGRRFPTPFAKPPFRGLSPPPVNVLYGLINLALAYTLLVVVGSFELRSSAPAAVTAAGFALWALMTAWRAGKLLGP
jgi:hypothetical protein